uniref:Mediator of RNA polymerase II transcription subunit 24 n=1 Tax=Meloidogyne javanica TaxID=6303 RepID=A0A915MLX5_MELJA
MVVSSTTNNTQQLDALLRNCLSQRLEPNEFFEEACRMIIEEDGQFPERVLNIANNYASAFPEETDIFPLALAYLKILFVHGLIQPQKYLTILTTFDCWTHPCKIEEIASDLESYINNKRFSTPPKSNWQPCREDFIHRKYRPALLSLGSIFAIFRVIKTADEVADTFLTVGNILGMEHEQIVEDLLRADQVDDKKSDNVFRFFFDGLKKADVVNSKEHEFLTKKRDLKRSQNEELPAGERQMIVRSELISRVQKAKRGIDTLVPENTERLLRRLLSLGEIPIDMLCSIYCACGELSLFSSKLAALNAQAQQPITGENVSGATTNAQGRLLIFDSTFLLMARIQHVFADMRLEELVGGRLHCAFYRWTQRYQKCIEESESMCFVFTGGSSNEDSTDSSFRSNFQRNQFQAMRSQKQPFWLAEDNDFGNTIETVPLIGELLLEEFSRGSPNSNEINNIFWAFSQMSCLWLCLVQWLDAQQPTIGNTPRQTMARSMREFEVKLQQQKTASEKDNKDNGERLQSLSYSILIARRLLRQIVDQRIKKEHPYTWLVGFAQRPLPALPFGRKMSRMDIWLQCWMRQMMNQQRIVTVDESELASELCLAATITYPVPCLCEMIKQLVECILFERAISTSSTTIAIQPNIHSAFVPNIVSAVSSTINSNEHSVEEQKHLTTNQHKQQTNISTQQKHSLSALEQQQKHSLQQQPTQVKRHPVVGQLSTKATVIAKMLVRAMQLLLWAGDRRVLEKREREKRIQQFGLITQQQQPSEQSSRKRSQIEINENICEEGQQQMDQTPCSSSSTEQQQQSETLGILKEKSVDVSSSVVETCTSSMNETITTLRLPKDALKAQLTVSNVFERFERIVRDCNLRPPVTFIIFFIHELAAAPQTEYWRRLVSIMPVNLVSLTSPGTVVNRGRWEALPPEPPSPSSRQKSSQPPSP